VGYADFEPLEFLGVRRDPTSSSPANERVLTRADVVECEKRSVDLAASLDGVDRDRIASPTPARDEHVSVGGDRSSRR
jgi:hypothetical protein